MAAGTEYPVNPINPFINMLADLVVLPSDILTVPDDAIKDIQAVRTIVGGKTVFQR